MTKTSEKQLQEIYEHSRQINHGKRALEILLAIINDKQIKIVFTELGLKLKK